TAGSAGIRCEIAKVMTETPIITAAMPTSRRATKPRKRIAARAPPRCLLHPTAGRWSRTVGHCAAGHDHLLSYRREVQPPHRVPGEPLEIRAKTEELRRLVEHGVRA